MFFSLTFNSKRSLKYSSFTQDTNLYMEELVRPILACFLDTDSRVRYYACESLYNVAKVGRGALLPQFNEVFDVLAKLVADPDQNVKSGAELLDRLLKVLNLD